MLTQFAYANCVRTESGFLNVMQVTLQGMPKKRLSDFGSLTEYQEWQKKKASAGGRKRSANLTKKQRKEAAQNAARVRWAKVKRKET